MNTPPESQTSIWKRPIKHWAIYFVLLALATLLILFVYGMISGSRINGEFWVASAVIALAVATIITLIGAVFRWIRRPRNFAKALFGLACVVTAIALFYAEEDLRGNWAWNRFKREWEAKGEHFKVSELAPKPVPDDQNFALTPLLFSTYGSMIDKTGHEIEPRNTNVVPRLNLEIYRTNDYSGGGTNGNWAKGTLTDLGGWQQYYRTPATNGKSGAVVYEFPISAQPQAPAQDVLLALSKYDATLEELRLASKMPYSRFPLEYEKEDPAMILLPHLAKLKQTALFLTLRSIAELQAGKTDQAAADVQLGCYVTQASETEPFFICQLVRMAMFNAILQPVYEGLAEHKWSDAQLAVIDKDFAKFDFLAAYRRSISGEAAETAEFIAYIERTRKISPIFLNLFGHGQGAPFPAPVLDAFCFVSPSGWFRQNQISISELYVRDVASVVNVEQQRVSPTLADAVQAGLNETVAHPTPYTMAQHFLLSPAGNNWFSRKHVAADKFAYFQTAVNLARTAIALERFKLAHGNYPDSLNVLAPEFIQALPNDIIGGQPLKYRRTKDSFVLYSVGWNEKDDGGVAAFTSNDAAGSEIRKTGAPDPDHGDWVWSYPGK